MLRAAFRMVAGLLLATFVLVGCQTVRHSGQDTLLPADPDLLRVGTYNVHYIIMREETGAWSVGDWERRKGPLDQAFKAVAADLIAFQEMESFGGGSESEVNLTLDWLLENNPAYAAGATGDPSVFPATQPILYRNNRLELLDQGWFFFSPTPDVLYARTYNGSYPAFASWAQFRDMRSGAVFRVVNVHTDYGSRSNRLQSIDLVVERTAPWIADGQTVFVVGDLNGRFGDAVVEKLQDAGLRFAPVEGATYHFNRGLNLFAAIDHIAVSGAAELARPPVVLRRQFDGEWPTDHYPVIADYRLLAD